MTQRCASDIRQVRRSQIGDVDMVGLGETLTCKGPVRSTSSAKPKVTWLSGAEPDVPYGHRERPALVGGCRKRNAALWDKTAVPARGQAPRVEPALATDDRPMY